MKSKKGDSVSDIYQKSEKFDSEEYNNLEIFVKAKRDIVDYHRKITWLKAKEVAAIKEAHFSADQFTIMTKDGRTHEVSWFRLREDFEIINLNQVVTKAVSTIVFWPKIKGFYKIQISHLSRRLIVFDDKKSYYDYCDKAELESNEYCHLKNAIVFTRSDGRWRIGGGAYCSVPTIVESMFEFQYPVTAEQVEYMELFIEMIASVLDTAEKDGWITKKEQEYNRNVPKQFINDTNDEEFTDSDGDVAYDSLFLDRSLVDSKTYLYLMKHANGLTKIGVSRQPKIREKTLQAEDPRLELHYAVPASRSIEKRLHDIFSEHRVRGEWFRLSDNHVQWIKLLCGRDVSTAMQKKETCDTL